MINVVFQIVNFSINKLSKLKKKNKLLYISLIDTLCIIIAGNQNIFKKER